MGMFQKAALVVPRSGKIGDWSQGYFLIAADRGIGETRKKYSFRYTFKRCLVGSHGDEFLVESKNIAPVNCNT